MNDVSLQEITAWVTIAVLPIVVAILAFFLKRYVSRTDESLKENVKSIKEQGDDLKKTIHKVEESFSGKLKEMSETIKRHETTIRGARRAMDASATKISQSVLDFRRQTSEETLALKKTLLDVKLGIATNVKRIEEIDAKAKKSVGAILKLGQEVSNAKGKILDLDEMYTKDKAVTQKKFNYVKKVLESHQNSINKKKDN